MLSVKEFFSVASLTSFLPFVPVCLSSVSGPCPYPSCLCLPLHTSFFKAGKGWKVLKSELDRFLTGENGKGFGEDI
jgi:hypothetical protein